MARSVTIAVLGVVLAVLLGASMAGAQEPILRVEGRITSVSPWEMVLEISSGGVVMIDLSHISQSETRQLSANDYVIVIGFLRRPSHKMTATSIQRTSPWVPMTPRWAPQNP